MATIVLVSCGSAKKKEPSPARELYTGNLFRASFAYAQALNADKIFILSALHGAVDPAMEIAPYNVTLSPVSKKIKAKQPGLRVLTAAEKLAWAVKVTHQLAMISNIEEDQFIFLAGSAYINPLRGRLVNIYEPLKGINLFDRVSWIKIKLAEIGS
ncbi:MAG: hypothetical protein BGO55_08485 [Sphingobacteriales bacterium 50-39]|nr:hypothetical protein [Sphingobacteriales bacterium]OJW59300.1 MAG: hypothetical protein BGO55_08485 [Sphingobacteriales bacterium 50-39]